MAHTFRLVRSITALVALFFLPSVLFGGVPQMMNYQGRLTDSSGDPVADGNYQITFSIYSVPSGGTALWTSGEQSVGVEGGLFNHYLGSSNPLPDSIFAKFMPVYLGIKVGSDAEITPRTQLVSVGYAFQALRGDTAGYATTVADNAITSAKIADGTIQLIDLGQNGATVNQIIKWNGANWALANDETGAGSKWTVADSVLYTNYKWGLARGGSDNKLWGISAWTHVNLGVACTTGTSGYSRAYSTVSGGHRNTASREAATVSGGYGNTASLDYATVSGGFLNTASGNSATVSGGAGNTASGLRATVSGGQTNTASGYTATVSGGRYVRARGAFSTVGGGGGDDFADSNSAVGDYSTIAGGRRNIADGDSATIGGGANNTASGASSTVPGGSRNTAAGALSLAAGYRAKANHDGAFVWGDNTAADFASSGNNQFLIRAGGGVGIGTNSPTAQLHVNGTVMIQDNARIVRGDSTRLVLRTSTSNALNRIGLVFENNNHAVFMSDDTRDMYYLFTSNLVKDRTYDARLRVLGKAVDSWGNYIQMTHDGTDGIISTDVGDIAINPAGNVGIGTTTPTQKLHVVGNICYTGTIGACSDERYKQDIETIGNALETLLKLRGVTYNWKQGEYPEMNFDDEKHLGFLAQEVKDLLPGVVLVDDQGYMSIDYGRLTPVLVEAMKELKTQNDELRTKTDRIAELESQMADLKAMLLKLAENK